MEPLASKSLEQPDFLLRTLMLFPHPSISLWRAIEAREVWKEFRIQELGTPVLDLGCGDGRFSTAVFDGARIDIGVDISPNVVFAAKGSSGYGHLMTGDGSKLPFQDGVFETVFSNSVLEHIPNVPDVLGEVRRVLKAGGTFVFTVPSPNFSRFLLLPSMFWRIPLLNSLARWYSKKRNLLLAHNNICELEVWRKWLEYAGFQEIQGRFCLSKVTLLVWDVMALTIYLIRFPLRGNPQILNVSLRRSQKLRVFLLSNLLRVFYLSNSTEGADMIITAGTPQQAMKLGTSTQRA